MGVRQGCVVSPVLFNLFLEKIMKETRHDHLTYISIGGRPISNFRFADDIDLIGGASSELQDLTNRLYERARAYGLEVSTEKSKIMVNSMTNTSAEIAMNGEKLVEMTSFKYLSATLPKDGTSTAVVRIINVMSTAAMARTSTLLTSSFISFPTKYRLFKSIVVPILLYDCETLMFHADTERMIQVFEH